MEEKAIALEAVWKVGAGHAERIFSCGDKRFFDRINMINRIGIQSRGNGLTSSSAFPQSS